LDAIHESERTSGVTIDSNIEKAEEHNSSLASVTRELSNGDMNVEMIIIDKQL
jgi:hypothetical protein